MSWLLEQMLKELQSQQQVWIPCWTTENNPEESNLLNLFLIIIITIYLTNVFWTWWQVRKPSNYGQYEKW